MPHIKGVKEIALLCASSSPAHNMESNRINHHQDVKDNSEHTDQFCCHTALTAEEEDQMNNGRTGDMQYYPQSSKHDKFDYYKLMHRRFGHMGVEKLRNLHKVTKFNIPIQILLEIIVACKD
ncbi:hypothetical protein K3495_g17339 [Podosphaera aphanis]|nr:hypothetical protein K3495_g17339 [Podosphaera aphanis]